VIPSRDCPHCHGHHTMNARRKPDATLRTEWNCLRCGHQYDEPVSDTDP
jgi:transposase